MIKQLLIAGLLLMLIVPYGSAWVLYSEFGAYSQTGSTGNLFKWYNASTDAYAFVYTETSAIRDDTYCDFCFHKRIEYYDGSNYLHRIWGNTACWGTSTSLATYTQYLGNSKGIRTNTCAISGGYPCFLGYDNYYTAILFYSPDANTFIINGTTCGIDNVSLYTDDVLIGFNNTLLDNCYSFNVINNTQYTLIFNDGHEYEFICDGNEVYDRDACTYITLNFKDNCGNLLRETEFQYCNHLECIACYFKDTSSGSYDILFENQDYLEIWADSAIGDLAYNISSPQDISYTILNDKIAWHNNIFVRDGNTSMIIEDALVTFSQDCIIDASSYPSRQKYSSVDGYAYFDQCELDMAYITVTATGYKPLSDSISPIHLDAFNLSQTIIAILYPIDDPTNESAMTLSGTIATTYIYFKDSNGNYTNSILDTDEYVDLYYYNNNTEDASMTLKFQKYNIYTGLEDLLSWNIPHDTSGYKRIYNANFSDHTYSYYGYLYNVEIDGWNRRTRLSVRNETKEVIDHYQNLSTILWFENKNPQGDIDYREDISVIAYAKSNNSSLLEISLELYDNSAYVDHINLTWADFVSAETLKWYYEWSPDHLYVNGHNYTVTMHGFDHYLLRTDYINASDFRKNKLTIIVKDRWGSNLDNAYVFLEGYGSLSTGISYYNSYVGLDNGDYRYKASKSGYSASGWDNINLTDSDKIVCYVLTSDTGNTTYVPKKFDDTEIKLIFFPLMFFLLIMILIGGFKYVSS